MNRFATTTDIVYTKNIKKDIVIAHISDLHFSSITSKKMLDKLANYLINMKPDYIMITGDVIDKPDVTKDNNKIKELVAFLASLGKQTKVMISLGNHDILRDNDFRFFDKLNDIYNIYVLNNTSYQDEFIYVSGFTMPTDYYYNIDNGESIDTLLDNLNKNKKLTTNLPKELPKVALMHSPMLLDDKNVLNIMHEYNLILCGHTHNGLVPKWLYFIFKGNRGFVGPYNHFFPKIAKGKLVKNDITIIINGAITKFSKQAGIFSKINFIYNKSVNKIIIRKKRGINNEN